MQIAKPQLDHIKSLEWAVWFAQADPAALREGDWINAKEDLWKFLRGDQERPAQKPGREMKTFADLYSRAGEKALRLVQEALRSELRNLAFDETKTRPGQWVEPVRIEDAEITVAVTAPDRPFEQWISLSADVVTQSRSALFNHLISSGILWGQLRVCPECRRIFLIKRRPRADLSFYCSLRCARAAATRRYKERHAKRPRKKRRAAK